MPAGLVRLVQDAGQQVLGPAGGGGLDAEQVQGVPLAGGVQVAGHGELFQVDDVAELVIGQAQQADRRWPRPSSPDRLPTSRIRT